MTSRLMLSVTLLTLFTMVHALCAGERPNIILVMADDHGYGDAGFTGHPFVRTPNLDQMSAVGVVFNRFYASAPVCSPTRASVLTGRHPFRVNVPNHGHYMRPNEITIAEALKTVGYHTGHFGKWHIGSVQPGSPTSPGGAGFDEWLSGLNFFDNNPYLSRNGEYVQLKGAGTVISMDATLEFIDKHRDSDNPFFAVTWFPAPHDPHQEVPEGADKDLYAARGGKLAGYFREIALLDAQVGRLRQKLRDWKIAEETLLIYCSDNGGLASQTSGGRAKKGSIYEGGLRVPAIFEWPSKYEHKIVTTPAVASDLYPTLVGLAGVEVDSQPPLDGVDLTPIIAGQQKQRPPIGFWHGHTQGQATWSDRIIKALKEAEEKGQANPFPNRLLKNVEQFPVFGDDGMRGHAAWTDWPWKLHRIEEKGKVRIELYNLSNDYSERTDLSENQPERVARMKKELETWQRSVLASWSGADYEN